MCSVLFDYFIFFFHFGYWCLSSFDLKEWSCNLDLKLRLFFPPADLFITSHLSLVILPTTLLYNQFVFSTSVNKFVIRKHSYVYMLICVILFWNPCLTCLCDNNKQHIIIFSLNNYKSPREALLKILIIYNLPSSLHWVQWSLL